MIGHSRAFTNKLSLIKSRIYKPFANKELKKPSFSNRKLIVFGTIFSLVGGYAIYTSFAAGNNYYVATTGLDTNAGTEAAPFKTIQRAITAVSNNSCDNIIVKDGTYTVTVDDSTFGDINKSGTAGCPLTIKSENKWGAKLDGQNLAKTGFVVTGGAQYVQIDGFEIYNIADGEVVGDGTPAAGGEGSASGIELYSGGANSVIVNNNIHDIGRHCTNTTNGQVGVFIQKANITLEKNIIHDIGRYQPGEGGCTVPSIGYSLDHGIYLNGSGSATNGVTIKNNIFYNTDRGWQIQIYPGTLDNIDVVNNTFSFCNSHKNYTCMIIGANLTNTNIKNNIFYNPSGGKTIERNSGTWTMSISNNITSGDAMLDSSAPAGTTLSANQLNTNPLLVNPPTDFHLQSNSPAINTGVDLSSDGVTSDYEGNTRPKGAAFDIGAYEIEIVTAHLWIDINGGTCTRQATAGAYVDGQACPSFDAAWDAASSGDTIRVKAATYSAQTITGHKTSETKVIAENGTTLTGALIAGANFMTVENITINAGNAHGQDSGAAIDGSNVTFRDVKLHGAYVSLYVGGNNFTWQRGSLGQDGTTGGQRQTACDGGNGDGEPIWVDGNGATFDGIRINPQLADSTPVSCSFNGYHLENIRVQSAQNLTVKNSWFLAGSDAGSGHIFVTSASPSATAATGLKLLNNIFEPVNGSYAMQVHSNVTNCGWTFAYNTWYQGAALQCNDSNSNWIGNLGVYPGCVGTHVKNVWQHNSSFTCGSDTWISGPQYGTGNLGIGTGGHLNAGSPAIDAGETPSASDYCTGSLGSVDFESGVRPNGSACDAGADEYGSVPTGEVANIWVDTNGGSCTRQATAGAYVDSQACASVATAYATAQAGDTILIASGTYGSENVANRSLPGSPVVVKTASGATVNFTDISIDTSNISLNGPNFNIRSMNIGNGGNSSSRRTDITLDGLNVDAQNTLNTDAIWAGNITNFTLRNSQVGNTMAGSGPNDTAKSVMTCAGNSTCHNTNMVFENNLFYDADTASGSQAHLECIWAGGVQGFTLRKNTFRDCTYFDVFITVVVPNNQPQPSNHIFEDNLFGQTVHPDGQDFGYNISLHSDVQPSNFVFRNNTIEGAIATANGGGAIQAGGWQIIGNIVSNGIWLSEPEPMGCRSGITISYNVMPNTCGSNTTTATSSAIRNGWVSPKASYAGADDFHLLAGSPAVGAGNPASAGTLDYDGVTRGNPPDTGAYEYTGSGDSTPPSVPTNTVQSGSTATTISLSWTVSTDNVAVTGYRIYKNSGVDGTTTNTTYTLTGLTCGTTYTIGLTAYDAAANESNVAFDQGPMSTASCDTTPPAASITAPTNGATVSGSSVTISANASDNIGVAGVQFKMDGFNQGAEDTSSPYSTIWNTTTLGNGTHTLTATARDAAGNTTTSSTITVTVNNATPPPPDTTAPAVPTGLNSPSKTTTTISLAWNASTDTGGSGLAGYRLYRSTSASGTYSLLTTTSGLSYTNTGLSATTTYYYKLTAYDNSANESAQTTTLSVATTANPSPTPTPTPTPTKLGDLNSDNTVNIFDLSILLSHYGGSGMGDLNTSGSVDVIDLSILLSNYGK